MRSNSCIRYFVMLACLPFVELADALWTSDIENKNITIELPSLHTFCTCDSTLPPLQTLSSSKGRYTTPLCVPPPSFEQIKVEVGVIPFRLGLELQGFITLSPMKCHYATVNKMPLFTMKCKDKKLWHLEFDYDQLPRF